MKYYEVDILTYDGVLNTLVYTSNEEISEDKYVIVDYRNSNKMGRIKFQIEKVDFECKEILAVVDVKNIDLIKL